MKRHVVVTGVAEGIGRSIAEEFASHGYAVTGVDINAELASEVQAAFDAQGRQFAFLQANLSQTDDLDHLLAALTRGKSIDVLVHNAGINCFGPFSTSDIATQQRVLDVNLHAPLYLTSALLDADMIASYGSIAFVSSLSRFVSYPGAAVYSASKDGLASYARSLAVALSSRNIHVLTVYPGPTRTAHAQRYSPDNSRESKRMAPEVLAAAVYRATVGRKRVLIPGLANRLLALAGLWAPRLIEPIMRKTLYDKVLDSER